MRAAVRLTLSAVLAAVVLATVPGAGWADADPPSDVLPIQDVYFPYQPTVSKPLAAALTATVARAKGAGYPLKVAIVASEADLGAIPNMFNKPGSYAPFLARELGYSVYPTLVVMPAGLAVANATPQSAAAIKRVRVDKDRKSDGLVRAALQAIPKMATAAGHPTPATKLPRGADSAGGGTSPLIVFGAPVALVALAALAVGLRSRRRDHEPGDPSPGAGESVDNGD